MYLPSFHNYSPGYAKTAKENHFRSSSSLLTSMPSNRLQRSINTPSSASFKFLRIVAPLHSRLHIGGTLVIRRAQHTNDAEQNGLWGLHGGPALGCGFVAVLVFFGRMQD